MHLNADLVLAYDDDDVMAQNSAGHLKEGGARCWDSPSGEHEYVGSVMND